MEAQLVYNEASGNEQAQSGVVLDLSRVVYQAAGKVRVGSARHARIGEQETHTQWIETELGE